MADLRTAGIPFGVNMFVPSGSPLAEAEFRRYARTIAGEGAPYGLDLAGAPLMSDERPLGGQDRPAPRGSGTGGQLHVRRAIAGRRRPLRRAGSRVLVTVTSVDEARAAADADGLIVQSSAAGAHSGTHDPARVCPRPH